MLKNSFKTDVALEHDFGKVPVSRNRKETDRKAPREREREQKSVTSTKKSQRGLRISCIHGVCLPKSWFCRTDPEISMTA